jgi:hypothetical protein
MKIEQTGQNELLFFHKPVFGLSGILFILIITGISEGLLPIAGLIIVLIFSVKNFGHPCPLLMSLRDQINHTKTKCKSSNMEE